MLIDSHTHLYLEQFDKDREAVIERAVKADVGKMLLPNIDTGTISDLLALCRKFPEHCLPMAGLHPTSVKSNYQEELSRIRELLDEGGFIAVGEIGMDLYWDKTFREEQEEALGRQIEWAVEKDLPVVIHSRDSFAEIFEVIETKRHLNPRGVFHSFTGNQEQLEKALGFGFYIGINGIVTFKNSELGEVVRKIPEDRLLLETDSPFLSPVPRRGKRNESSHLPFIAEKIAEITGRSFEEIVRTTSSNARKLFNITNE